MKHLRKYRRNKNKIYLLKKLKGIENQKEKVYRRIVHFWKNVVFKYMIAQETFCESQFFGDSKNSWKVFLTENFVLSLK